MSDLTDLVGLLQSAYGSRAVRTASIGGSGTWALDRAPGRRGFPEELPSVGGDAVLGALRDVETPFGTVPLVKLLEVRSHPVVRIPVHGWHFPVPNLDDTVAVFWLLAQLAVEQVVVDASVGGLVVEPWDVVIPDDILICGTAKLAAARLAAQLGRSPWIRMKDPFCSRIRGSLAASVRRLRESEASLGLHPLGRLVEGGTYYTTPLSVFETACEVVSAQKAGATVVGMSTGQEVACARLCGMCFAVVNPVANLAEGLGGGSWITGGMARFYDELALPMARVVWWTLEQMVQQQRTCDCASLAAGLDLDRYIYGRD